jgi:hypothetical protein
MGHKTSNASSMKCSIGESIVKGKVGIMASPNAFGGDGGVGVGGEQGGRGTKVSVVHSSAATTITTTSTSTNNHIMSESSDDDSSDESSDEPPGLSAASCRSCTYRRSVPCQIAGTPFRRVLCLVNGGVND